MKLSRRQALLRIAREVDGGFSDDLRPARQTRIISFVDGEIERQRQMIQAIAAKHGARNVRVFGSRARGTGSADSDLDLLVDMEKGRSLLDLIELERELETSLGIPVDVLTPASISPYLRDDIEREAVAL